MSAHHCGRPFTTTYDLSCHPIYAGIGIIRINLKRRGQPGSLDELHEHDLIQFILPSTGRPMPWIFTNNKNENVDFTFHSRQRVHEDVLASIGWAIAGGGLFQIYHFVAAEAVKQGRLVEVLQEIGGRSRPFYILYPQNRHLSAKVRAFVDYLVNTVRN